MSETAQAVKPAAQRKGRAKVEKRARALQRLEVVYVPVDSIRPNKYNSNVQSARDFELLCKSIQEDGFDQPVIVHKATSEIVDGEHRWRAAKRVGMVELPVVFSDMDEVQRRIATLRHNRARGDEELETTVALLRDLDAMGAADWAKDSLDMEDLEWTRLLEDIPATDLAAEEYTEGWEPERATTETDSAGSETETAELPGQGEREGAMTEAAEATMRERQERIRMARTEEEREKAKADLDVYRITLVFSGKEAELIKAVLGHRPAQALLVLCRDYIAAQDAAEGGMEGSMDPVRTEVEPVVQVPVPTNPTRPEPAT